jgi:hypothetical protein
MANKAAIQNPYLEAFSTLVGSWKTVGKHPYLQTDELHGSVSFEWVESGAFIKMTTSVDHPQIPDGISLFGSDDEGKRLNMLYFDERKVSRIYEVSFEDNTLTWWRDDPKFSQRFAVNVEDDGNTMRGKGSMRRGGKEWEDDLELVYSRIA